MKSRLITISITYLALIITAIISFYEFRTLKAKKRIEEYLKQQNWTSLKNKYAHYTNRGHLTIFWGDSMTENLQTYLTNSDFILNMGIGGDFTEGLIARVTDVTRLSPDNLFIMIGVNDILTDLPLKQIKENYEKLIDLIKLQSPKTKVFIQPILPITSLKSMSGFMIRCNKKIVQLNSFIFQLAILRKLIYIDMYQEFLNSNSELKIDLTTDGIHLNEKGYLIWKRYLKKYLELV